jgi:hypothetical protein
MTQCSFCRRQVGEGTSQQMLDALESGQFDELSVDDHRKIADKLRQSPDRKVRLLMPGPGKLFICDVCIEAYAESAKRELSLRAD